MEQTLKEKISKYLFHGTLMDRAANILIDGFDFSKLNDRADFGKGFYVTDSYALAEHTAITRYNQEKQEKGSAYPPVVIKIKVVCNNITDYAIKEFYGETLIWKRFICCNRWFDKVKQIYPLCDHNTDQRYDIIVGLTADGKISKLNRLIKKDEYKLSDEFVNNVKPFVTTYSKTTNGKRQIFETKAYQISFHNEKFIKSCIRYKGYDIILIEKEDGYYE